MSASFDIVVCDPSSRARVATLSTPHGDVRTPALCPVATQASVKSLDSTELRQAGAEIILANTHHVALRPGADLVARLGGLHGFMAWDGPIMTDSGGSRVFSQGFNIETDPLRITPALPGEGEGRHIRGQRPRIVRTDDDGITYTSYVDGSTHRLTPEISIQVQERLGGDLMLTFDEWTSPLHDEQSTARALRRTHAWARRCLDARSRADQALLGVIQGGPFESLRRESAAFIGSLPFDGFAIGGPLGQSREEIRRTLGWGLTNLPDDRPRHLASIGRPEDIFDAVECGIDLFDCDAPTRYARQGILCSARGRLSVTGDAFLEDLAPVEEGCTCYTCRHFSRAYLRHLFAAKELLGYRLASIHNLSFFLGLMRRIREGIERGSLREVRSEFEAGWRP